MKKAVVATLALISLLHGGCKKEEPVDISFPAAEGAGRKINFATRSGDSPATGPVAADAARITTAAESLDTTSTAPQ